MNPLIKQKELFSEKNNDQNKTPEPPPSVPDDFMPPKLSVPDAKTNRKESIYFLNVPEEVQNKNPEIKAIVDSGKNVEDLSEKEMSLVYHFIEGFLNARIYSASIINDIEIRGGGFDNQSHSESDSLFMGTQIHLAMETGGENLNNLITFEESIGQLPEKPDVSKLTPDLIKILELITNKDKIGFVRAYTMVKNNKMVSEVKKEEIDKWEDDDEHEPSKELAKLINAATKENDKIKPYYSAYKEYQERLDNYEKKKLRLRKNPKNIILDELDFRKINPVTMKKTITMAYNSLTSNTTLMNVYKNGYTEIVKKNKIKTYTEKVILWNHKLKDGTKIYCKSMLDKLVLDFTNKIAFVEDIKTHSKPARKFISTNYFSYGYFRSMSFYVKATRFFLNEIGQNPDEWKIIAILLPVSTFSFETGCYNPIVVISDVDIKMGESGGYIKPIGTKFNKMGQVQWGLDKEQFNNLSNLGLIHNNAYEYYINGWEQVVSTYEQKFILTNEKV